MNLPVIFNLFGTKVLFPAVGFYVIELLYVA